MLKIIEILEIIIIILIGVAYITLAERKVLGIITLREKKNTRRERRCDAKKERTKYSRIVWNITTNSRWDKISNKRNNNSSTIK